MADSQFKKGYQPPVDQAQGQELPGSSKDLKPKPLNVELPTGGEDGDYEKYKAAGKLQGKKALITGGDSGIGRAIAILFAMEGAESVIAFLEEEEKDAIATQKVVEAHGGKVHLWAGDLKSQEKCRELVDFSLKTLGGLNILVNNAGTQQIQESIDTLSEDQWRWTFDTNINSVFYISKYVVPHLQRGDTIINCSSINPYIGRPDVLDYSASKGAMISFTRALSNQLVGKGIRVNAVCPGPVWTPLVVATMPEESLDKFNETPMGRPGQPSEIATCFVFLASNDSSFMSGQSLHPNGGSIVGS